METLLLLKTNEGLVAFVLNNMILLLLIQKSLGYICKKTPWAADDDLPSFFGGLIKLITNRGKENHHENEQD